MRLVNPSSIECFQLGRPHVIQSKRDHTGNTDPAHSDNSTKVEVVGQDRPSLDPGLFNDLLVFQPLEPLVTQVNRIMPLRFQKGDRATRQPYVGKKLYAETPVGT
jgi:hypothetical protein